MAKEAKETKKESTTDNRKQLINDALKEIEKRFGEGSVFYYPIIIGCSIAIAYVIYSCVMSLIK